MRLLTLVCVLLLSASSAFAQSFDCPVGSPASLRPGPSFVPTTNCQGWVPANHPLARRPIDTAPPPPALDDRIILTHIEFPTAGSTVSASRGGINQLSGWALDCPLGNFPPLMRIIETKPDGSLREVPNDYFPVLGGSRPDVQNAFRLSCPAVLNAPDSHGNSLGAVDGFGWVIPLRSAVTEIGVHTFTVTFLWPAQNHAGSTAISINIVP